MADDNILKLGMSQEELEDTIQFSQQMVQVLLETIGETLGQVDQLRQENEAMRAALQTAGVPFSYTPPAAAPPAETAAPEELEAAAGEDTAPGVSLPAATAPQDAPPAVVSAPPAESGEPPAVAPAPSPAAVVAGLGEGVLIVDDSRILQMRLRSIIEPMGYTIVGYATNGAEGVKAAMTLKPRTVVMDYNMPVLNGLEAMKVLHRDLPQTRVIMCAADLSATLSRELMHAGCTEILTKPIQLDNFVRAIKRCMDSGPVEPRKPALQTRM
jgi:two-component system chemotaxis response regulator CheY